MRAAIPAALLVLLGLLGLASLGLGTARLGPADVLAALATRARGEIGLTEADAIMALRLPRAALAALTGLGLGVAGALMQAVTRNPLADPGLMGVNAGAAFAVIAGVALAGIAAPGAQLWLALAGALAAGAVVQVIGGSSPLRVTLAGVALSAVLGGIGSALTLLDPELFRRVLGWGAGSLVVTDAGVLRAVAPVIALGALLGVALGRGLDALSLGDEVAQALGVRVGLVRALALAAVTTTAGAATAAAGPLVFVGLVVPHLARAIAGPDQARLLRLSALIGPALLLGADLVARLALRDAELPLGLVTAVIGAPLMIAIARRPGLAA